MHLEAAKSKEKTKKDTRQRYDDPEMEAEAQYAKKNCIPLPSRNSPSKSVAKTSEALISGTGDKALPPKVLKTGKAERKARSRGVSGCSSKKDGGRFEYGLDCVDLEDEDDNSSSSDYDVEYDEYADYVFQYSDDEIRSIIQDYLLNGSKEDALGALEKFRITADATFLVLKDLIQLSLEAADCGGIELGTQLIDAINRDEWLSTQVLLRALEDIVDTLSELTIDSPKIVDAMAVFIAKLVVDEIFAREFIECLAVKESQDCKKLEEEAGMGTSNDNATNFKANRIAKKCYNDALTYADNRTLLDGKCVPAGGHQSVEVLSAQFKMILKEFLVSNDKDVACLRVNELKVPHFNHEFVYQAGLMALEKMHDTVMVRLSELLKQMYDNGSIAKSCFEKGYEKLYESLSDLKFDLPAAYTLAHRWVDKSLASKFLSGEIAEKCPIRTRSRAVSEGPDGKLFCMADDDDLPISNNNMLDTNKTTLDDCSAAGGGDFENISGN